MKTTLQLSAAIFTFVSLTSQPLKAQATYTYDFEGSFPTNPFDPYNNVAPVQGGSFNTSFVSAIPGYSAISHAALNIFMVNQFLFVGPAAPVPINLTFSEAVSHVAFAWGVLSNGPGNPDSAVITETDSAGGTSQTAINYGANFDYSPSAPITSMTLRVALQNGPQSAFGIDNLSVITAAPEPTTLGLFTIGSLLFGARRKRVNLSPS